MSDAIQLEQKIGLEAIEWYLALSEQTDDKLLYQQWQSWLAADPQHQLAWSRIEQVNHGLNTLPTPLSRAITEKTLFKTDKSRRHVLRSLVGIAVMSGGSWVYFKNETFLLPLLADYRTGIGETRSLTLSDGTQVDMNANSAFSIAYSENQRHLTLISGDIMITTAKDTRPFLLKTDWADLKPVGTRFYVRQRDNTALLAVYEGAVDFIRGNNLPLLRVKAGQQISFNATELGSVMSAQESMLAWQQYMLVADNMPLAEIVAQLQNYHHGWLRCDPLIAERRVSGTYPLNNIDQVLKALAATLQLELVYRTRYWITLKPQQKI